MLNLLRFVVWALAVKMCCSTHERRMASKKSSNLIIVSEMICIPLVTGRTDEALTVSFHREALRLFSIISIEQRASYSSITWGAPYPCITRLSVIKVLVVHGPSTAIQERVSILVSPLWHTELDLSTACAGPAESHRPVCLRCWNHQPSAITALFVVGEYRGGQCHSQKG